VGGFGSFFVLQIPYRLLYYVCHGTVQENYACVWDCWNILLARLSGLFKWNDLVFTFTSLLFYTWQSSESGTGGSVT